MATSPQTPRPPSITLRTRRCVAVESSLYFSATAVYVGPVVSYRAEKWWATLTVMPQVFGRNWDGVNDGARNLDLVHNERINIRLIFGFDL